MIEDDASKPLIYDEFDALRLKQNEGLPILEFDSLDVALDEYYAKVSTCRGQEQAEGFIAMVGVVGSEEAGACGLSFEACLSPKECLNSLTERRQ